MTDSRLPDALLDYIGGDASAGDSICRLCAPTLQEQVDRTLGPADPDRDDVVQDSLVAFLAYLRGAGVAPDNPEAFLTTMARNRCYNLLVWKRRRAHQDLADVESAVPGASDDPLEGLEAEGRRRLLREALLSLDAACRRLLRDVYEQERPIESLRRELGLGSVQAVYHRRNICIRKAQKFLNRRLLAGRAGGRGARRPPESGRETRRDG